MLANSPPVADTAAAVVVDSVVAVAGVVDNDVDKTHSALWLTVSATRFSNQESSRDVNWRQFWREARIQWWFRISVVAPRCSWRRISISVIVRHKLRQLQWFLPAALTKICGLNRNWEAKPVKIWFFLNEYSRWYSSLWHWKWFMIWQIISWTISLKFQQFFRRAANFKNIKSSLITELCLITKLQTWHIMNTHHSGVIIKITRFTLQIIIQQQGKHVSASIRPEVGVSTRGHEHTCWKSLLQLQNILCSPVEDWACVHLFTISQCLQNHLHTVSPSLHDLHDTDLGYDGGVLVDQTDVAHS